MSKEGSMFLPLFMLATTTWSAVNHLDRAAIQHEYQDGNFESVTRRISEFQLHNTAYTRDDSLFIAKNLAVIYCSNPATREKGKYWMNQMLRITPTAHLLDMYVSEDIDHVFEKVRSEYLATHPSSASTNSPAVNTPLLPSEAKPVIAKSRNTSNAKLESTHSSGAVWWWTGGLAAMAAVGTVAYLVVSDNQSPAKATVGEPVNIPGAGQP
jgi:hypothetical protein